MPETERLSVSCLVVLPQNPESGSMWKLITSTCREAGIQPVRTGIGELAQLHKVATTDFLIIDISSSDENTFYILGVAQAMGKAVIVLEDATAPHSATGFVQAGMTLSYEPSPAGFHELRKRLYRTVQVLRRSPNRMMTPPILIGPTRFRIDFDRLRPRDFENLCLELLVQMGFRNVEWTPDILPFDAVARFPRKDPDGLEYEEIWAIGMGLRARPEEVVDRLEDPDFIHRMLGLRPKVDRSVAVLVIQPPYSEWDGRWVRRRVNGMTRVRLWDRQYLTNLVQQFPQIGYKYFSDEARSLAEYRKTPEDLYQETVRLNEQLHAKNTELKEERDRRIRAEREAMWKELSFAAAHKLGNPVFALESFMGSLIRRIRDNRLNEALDLTDDMIGAIEDTKAIIEQFKSFTKAEDINPRPVDLAPLVRQACKVAESNGVKVVLELPADLALAYVDPLRISECFAELVANCHHWFNKPEKTIDVATRNVLADESVAGLDPGKRYVCVNFKDNGCGVPPENKSLIFNAFFSTYHHGTGLGLSLVRRIIENHGGLVREVGVPGQGAEFQMYLPAAAETKSEKG